MTAQAKCPHSERMPPAYDIDFYSDEVIRNPWQHYRRMRELGAVVWLPRLGNFAVTRHAESLQVLRDWSLFSSAHGVAADDVGCAFLKGNTLASDPPVHDAMRKAMGEPLLPRSLEQWRASMESAAEKIVTDLVGRGSFDGMRDFARVLPLTVVTELVGLPDDGRENMLVWAAASFDILGVQNERGRQGIETIKEMRHWIATKATRDRLKQGSWTARISEMAERGEIPPSFAPQLIRDYINPSLDTTISAIGQMLYRFGRNPDQWSKLRAYPSLIPTAINEAVRMASPIRTFSRTLVRDTTLAGVFMPAGARVMVLFASANHDERRYSDPEHFDVARDNNDHLGFGHGIHTCVGMHLARMEMEALLKAMLARIERIEVGEPAIALNNTIHSFSSLPVRFEGVTTDSAPVAQTTPTSLNVVVAHRSDAAQGIVTFDIRSKDGTLLPTFSAGSHIDVHLPNGLTRQYSLCLDPRERSRYRLGVLREAESRGGSVAVHDLLREGTEVSISEPRNLFRLNEAANRSLLFAGGIGITPILSMAYRLQALECDFELHYAVRSQARAAFLDEMLASAFGSRVHLYVDEDPTSAKFDATALVGESSPGTHLYCCGPSGFIEAVKTAAKNANWSDDHVHVEHFAAAAHSNNKPLRIVAKRSGITIEVSANESILDALRAHGIEVQTSCEAGACGTCLVRVLEGTPDHRDIYQTDEEKAANKQITVCCSRALTSELVLDI